jgi:hypothetical protein
MSTLYVCFLENDEEIMEHHILNRLAANLEFCMSWHRAFKLRLTPLWLNGSPGCMFGWDASLWEI